MCHPAQSAGITETLGWRLTWARRVSGVCPGLHRLLPFLCGFSPSGAAEGGGGGGSPFPTDPSASSAGAPSRAAEDGCYRGEQEQDGGGLPSLGAQMGSEGETVNEGFFTASRGGYQAGFHQPLALPF